MTDTIDRAAIIEALGLTVEAKFVPFSMSRNRDEKSPSLNWTVTLKRNGRDVLTTDYSAGVAHCPAWSKVKGPKNLVVNDAIFREECETGRAVFIGGPLTGKPQPRGFIKPDIVAVLYALTMDASVLDSAGFEDWASELGYDTDSRNAEKVYRACLDTALKLRAAIGDDGLARLRDAFQDY